MRFHTEYTNCWYFASYELDPSQTSSDYILQLVHRPCQSIFSTAPARICTRHTGLRTLPWSRPASRIAWTRPEVFSAWLWSRQGSSGWTRCRCPGWSGPGQVAGWRRWRRRCVWRVIRFLKDSGTGPLRSRGWTGQERGWPRNMGGRRAFVAWYSSSNSTEGVFMHAKMHPLNNINASFYDQSACGVT